MNCHPCCVSGGSTLDHIGPYKLSELCAELCEHSLFKMLVIGIFSHFILSVCVAGTQVFSGQSDFRVTTLKFHPKDHNVFLCGGFSSEIKAWDMRTGKLGRPDAYPGCLRTRSWASCVPGSRDQA